MASLLCPCWCVLTVLLQPAGCVAGNLPRGGARRAAPAGAALGHTYALSAQVRVCNSTYQAWCSFLRVHLVGTYLVHLPAHSLVQTAHVEASHTLASLFSGDGAFFAVRTRTAHGSTCVCVG